MEDDESEEHQYKTFKANNRQEIQEKTVNWNWFVIGSLIFAAIFGVIIGTNYLYKDSLFEYGNQITISVQSDSEYLNKFMKIVGLSGEIYGIIAIFIIVFSVLPYSDSLFIIIVYFFCSFVTNCLKLIHHESRPYILVDNN